MLTKNKHSKVNYISRLLVLPLAAIVFVGISCKVKMDTESQKTPDEIAVTAPSDEENGLLDDFGKVIYYDNKKVKSLKVFEKKSESPVELTFEDGSKENISLVAAEKAGIPIPPPPPPTATVKYTPPKVVKDSNVQFTPPKVVKDTIVPYAPPKVVKNKEVQYTPPIFVRIGSAGPLRGSISLQDIETAKKLEAGSDDYTVESFTVYFSGAGFPEVKIYSQNGSKFSSEIQKEWENIKPGTSVSFDQVMVKFKGEQIIKVNKPPGYIVY